MMKIKTTKYYYTKLPSARARSGRRNFFLRPCWRRSLSEFLISGADFAPNVTESRVSHQ